MKTQVMECISTVHTGTTNCHYLHTKKCCSASDWTQFKVICLSAAAIYSLPHNSIHPVSSDLSASQCPALSQKDPHRSHTALTPTHTHTHTHTRKHTGPRMNEQLLMWSVSTASCLLLHLSQWQEAVFHMTHIPHTATHAKSLMHFKRLIIFSHKPLLMATWCRTCVAHQRWAVFYCSLIKTTAPTANGYPTACPDQKLIQTFSTKIKRNNAVKR